METIIYYFSATGNSLQAAKIIADKLNAKLLPMPKHKGTACSADRIGLVFPTYFFGVPRTVGEFISELNVEKKNPYLFAVTTYGGIHGGVLGHLDHLLKKKGLKLSYGKEILSVANFIEEYNPMVREMKKKLEKANILTEETAAEIQSKKHNGPFRYAFSDKLFYKIYTKFKLNKDDGFHVDNTCIQCGLCRDICPNQNIALTNGMPVFQHNCEHCVACIHYCPKKAIQWKHATQKRTRYQHPDIPVREIIAGNK